MLYSCMEQSIHPQFKTDTVKIFIQSESDNSYSFNEVLCTFEDALKGNIRIVDEIIKNFKHSNKRIYIKVLNLFSKKNLSTCNEQAIDFLYSTTQS